MNGGHLMDWSHLPVWTPEQATDYFHAQGRREFSGAYLEDREWILKHGVSAATRGYREYVVCDDGLERPNGPPLARESKRKKVAMNKPQVVRDSRGEAVLQYPGGAGFTVTVPPISEGYRSTDRLRPDKQYAECPITGQIHDASDTSWWKAHWENLLRDQGMDRPPSPQQPQVVHDVRRYAQEFQHGADHVRRWQAVLAAVEPGYAERTGVTPMTLTEARRCEARYSRSRWEPVVNEMVRLSGQTHADPTPDPTPDPRSDGPQPSHIGYVYGEDLDAAARKADRADELLDWLAITAEVDLRMTGKCRLPAAVTLGVVETVENRYAKIRLDEVRERLTS